MNIWKIFISGEETGLYNSYHGLAKKAMAAGEKALALAKKEVAEGDKNFDDELYVSEITFVATREF